MLFTDIMNKLDNKIKDYIEEIINSLPKEEISRSNKDKEKHLLEYYQSIQWLQSRREYLDKNLDKISNSGIAHAALLLASIISSTEKKLYIFSEKLNREVTNLSIYKESLQSCIEGDMEIKILLEDNPDDTKTWKMIRTCYEEGYKNITVKKLSSEGKKYLKGEFNNELPNFTTNLKMYRLETDKQQMKAIGAFNRTDLCDILEQRFMNAFNKSENYFIM